MVEVVKALLNREPVVITGLVAAGVVLLAAHFNVVIDEASIEEVVLPIVTAVVARNFVTPVADPNVD